MATYTYPTNAVLTEIAEQIQPTLTMDDLAFRIMPIDTIDADVLIWEQQDSYSGLQQLRGLNGEPPKVQPRGARQFIMQPGVYGEHADIDEKMLTQRRPFGQFAGSVNVADLVADKQRHLLKREIDRIRYIIWTLITTGTFSVAHVNGGVQHTDTFNIGTSNGSTWATVTTATPLADLRAVQLAGPAQGTNFNETSIAIMNRTTANLLLSNTNAADIGGKRTSGLANILSFGEVNSLLTGEGLPNIVVYDDGYINDAGTFVKFIPNNVVVVVGTRPAGDPIARYLMTRNANRDDLGAGAYMMVEDTMAQNRPPRYIRVHRGHNGGPVIYYPGSIVIVDVS